MIVGRGAAALGLFVLAGACSDTAPERGSLPPAPGGAASTAGSATGGQTVHTGGVSTGGTRASGGSATGGAATGGAATGGVGTSGGATGGAATGGAPARGVATGGAATGGAGSASGGGSIGSSGSSGGGSAGSTHTGVWNVMLLGDSITASTCYPQLLAQQFQAGGHTNFALVGTQTTNQSCNGAPPVKTEGHGGYGVTYLPSNSTRGACAKQTGCGSYAELEEWAALAPDIVLMHYGTNDVWDGQSVASILSAYESVIAEFRKHNPNVIFFVSKIIQLDPSGCNDCSSSVTALANALTPDWASSSSEPSSPIHLVNAYDSGFDPSNPADTTDRVHPTPAGALKMATAIYADVTARGYF